MSLLSFLEGIEIQDSLKWSFRCRENYCCLPLPAFPLVIKNPPAGAGNRGDNPWVRKISWRREWPPTCLLAWRIPWTEEPGRLQSMGLQSQT